MFKYSICHPDKEKIEYRNNSISGDDVLKIAKDYPWIDILKFSDSIIPEDTYYSPSLDFTNLKNGQSFCLTAGYGKQNNLEFSLWYNRPRKVKVLFGLLGEKEEMMVHDIWGFDFNSSMKYLEHFVNGNYSIVEELYNK